MTAFKVGDRVRIVSMPYIPSDSQGLYVGNEGVVVGHLKNGGAKVKFDAPEGGGPYKNGWTFYHGWIELLAPQ